ncbi:hypothetical protein [Acetobacter sp.]|uniref:hypothetical protein n=1 Tax=Acetobacter sp. TaxID=440 RepID=UPI002586CFEC|nr:hypothetical protein [Acetobacter sp.]MCC6105917.1 hypothetical protein [Acetobacter sp.]
MAESFSTMPEPLTPADCDLRGYDFMPFYGVRYFRSSSYMQAAARNPRAGLAAMKLWWEAWSQVPCGSLPDDDIELGMLADFGTDKRGWARAKEIALRGFVKCSDGRLYHKELCEIALDKFDLRLKSDEKREADRERLKAWRAKQKDGVKQPNIETHSETDNETQTETVSETLDETGDETRFVAGKRVESRDNIPSLRSGPEAEARTMREAENSLDARTQLFTDGTQRIRHMTGLPERNVRALIGRWLKLSGDDAACVLDVIRQASDLRPAEPQAWCEAAVRHRASGANPKSRQQLAAETWANVPDIEGV